MKARLRWLKKEIKRLQALQASAEQSQEWKDLTKELIDSYFEEAVELEAWLSPVMPS